MSYLNAFHTLEKKLIRVFTYYCVHLMKFITGKQLFLCTLLVQKIQLFMKISMFVLKLVYCRCTPTIVTKNKLSLRPNTLRYSISLFVYPDVFDCQ